MTDRRSKYASSARDKTPSIAGTTARNLQENFATEFLKYSEEYNVHPLPKVIIKSIVDLRVPSTEDDGSPIFYLTYENKKLDAPKKIESKDALNSTMRRYNTITVLKLPNCHINAFGIMQIAEMLTNIGCIRDLNLDMNPNAQENYHLLCAPAGNLWYLSLKLCQISDDGVKKIANELKYRDAPNTPQLVILNLANNHITKNGAEHIGSMLRTNRSLKVLVLLGNRICDEGASMMLKELKTITLTHEEIMDLRRRKFAELTLLDQLMENRDNENPDKSINEELSRRSSKSRTRNNLTKRSKKSQQDLVKVTEEEILYQDSESVQRKEIILGGNKCHPFQNESFPINGMIISTGNLELQYLDLSYNYLTQEILKELRECLYYQCYMLRKDTTKGLLHVLLEGKSINQKDNSDWTTFQELLHIRQNGKFFKNDSFQQLVSEESKILRKNVKILKGSQENLKKKEN